MGTRIGLNDVDEECKLTVRYDHVNKEFGTQKKSGEVEAVTSSDGEVESFRLRETDTQKVYEVDEEHISILDGQTIGEVIDYRLPETVPAFEIPEWVEKGSTVKLHYTRWGGTDNCEKVVDVSGTRGSTLLYEAEDGEGRVTMTAQVYDSNGVKIGEDAVVSKPEIEQ